jgi:hypothetical protein
MFRCQSTKLAVRYASFVDADPLQLASKLDQRGHAHFLHHACTVDLDRIFRLARHVRDLLVVQSACQKHRDIAFRVCILMQDLALDAVIGRRLNGFAGAQLISMTASRTSRIRPRLMR